MADTPGSCRTNGQDGQRSHWVWIKVTLRIVWIASDQFSIVLTKQSSLAIDWLQGGLWVWLCGWNKKWGDRRVPGRGKSTTLRGEYLLFIANKVERNRWEAHQQRYFLLCFPIFSRCRLNSSVLFLVPTSSTPVASSGLYVSLYAITSTSCYPCDWVSEWAAYLIFPKI